MGLFPHSIVSKNINLLRILVTNLNIVTNLGKICSSVVLFIIIIFTDKTVNAQRELETTKQELYEAHREIFDYKNGLAKRIEVIEEIEVSCDRIVWTSTPIYIRGSYYYYYFFSGATKSLLVYNNR